MKLQPLIRRITKPRPLKANLQASDFKEGSIVVDQFRFLNEFEVLEMRLEILWDVVDYFIVTESPFTHSGKPKPLNFNLHRDRYSKYESKIIYNLIQEVPKNFASYVGKRPFRLDFNEIDPNSKQPYLQNSISYQREAFERDYQVEGLFKIRNRLSGDVVLLLSDVDEIPNPEVLKSTGWIDPNNLYICNQIAFLYKLNLLYQDKWPGTRIFRYSYLTSEEKSFHKIHAEKTNFLTIDNGGWHFSWMGGNDRFLEKLSAFPESDTFDTKDRRENSASIIDNRIDPLGRNLNLKKVPLDTRFPSFLLKNQERYENLIEK